VNLEQYIIKEFNIFPTPEQLKMIKKLSKEPEKVSEDYKMCVDFWLKDLHIGWDFQAMHGKSMKQIIVKIKKRLKEYDKPITDESIYNTFVYICNNLPDWFKDKDLNTINSKFNEIIEQIKRPSNNSKSINVDNLQQIAEQRYGNTKESV
jgi:hypothetical protein